MKFQSKLFSLVSILVICSGCSNIQPKEINSSIIIHSSNKEVTLDSTSQCQQELKDNKYEIKC